MSVASSACPAAKCRHPRRHTQPADSVQIPATRCPRITTDFIEDQRRLRGPRYVETEFNRVFAEASGQFFDQSAIDAVIDPALPPRPLGAGFFVRGTYLPGAGASGPPTALLRVSTVVATGCISLVDNPSSYTHVRCIASNDPLGAGG